MSRTVNSFMKGMGIGLAIGSVSGASGYCYMRKNKRGVRKNTEKAMRSVGCIVDNIVSMF